MTRVRGGANSVDKKGVRAEGVAVNNVGLDNVEVNDEFSYWKAMHVRLLASSVLIAKFGLECLRDGAIIKQL